MIYSITIRNKNMVYQLSATKKIYDSSTSAIIPEALRNVPNVLFIKITLSERQRVCDFYECI